MERITQKNVPCEILLFYAPFFRMRRVDQIHRDGIENDEDTEIAEPPEEDEEYGDFDEMDDGDYQRMPLRKKDGHKNKSDDHVTGKLDKPKKFPDKRPRKTPKTDEKSFGKKKFSNLPDSLPILFN